MWRAGGAVRRGLAAATNSTTIVAASSPSARPLLLPQQRRRALLLLRPAAAAAAAAAASTRSYSSHSRAHQQASTSSGAAATAATAAAAAVTLLAAANAWGEDSAARQDAGTFHARMPSRPHRVVYSISTYPGNEYIEDRHEIREFSGGDVFCGVYDGHGGWQVAEYASAHLSRNLEVELGNMGTLQGSEQVGKALVRAFERTDRGVIQKVHHAFEIGLGNVAKVGCCALAVLLRGHTLYVANAGDCRAVLGKRAAAATSPAASAAAGGKAAAGGSSSKRKEAGAEAGAAAAPRYEAVALSEDHNAKLPKEMEALRQAHPGEGDIVKCKHPNACYVKGRLQPTRALGDAYLKYPEFNGRPNRSDSSAGRYIPPPYTPPYITATPEVRVFPVLADPAAEFLILASDGVWDLLSNEEAVGFVGRAIAEGDVAHVSQRLIAHALETRAQDLGMTVEELRALPPGRPRRSKHDDMTCLVLLLQGPGSAAESGDTAAGTNPQDGIDVSIDPTMPPLRG